MLPLNGTSTIKQIVNDKKIPMILGTVDNTYELEPRTLYGDDVSELNVDELYQRMVDPARVKRYGQLNPQWLTATILAQRPNGYLYIIDGQNKACLYHRSGVKDIGYHCLVFVHDEDTSVGTCRKIEAKIFKNINENLKTLTILQKIRSGVIFGDSESCWVERVMKHLNLTCNGFGSQEDNAPEVIAFNQLYLMVKNSGPFSEGANDMESQKRISTLLYGLELYKRMWADDPSFNPPANKKKSIVHGNILKGCVLVHQYKEDALNDTRARKLNEYLIWGNYKTHSNCKTMSKKIGQDAHSDKRFLWDGVLQHYNMFCQNNGLNGISDRTYKKINDQHGKKFSNPF